MGMIELNQLCAKPINIVPPRNCKRLDVPHNIPFSDFISTAITITIIMILDNVEKMIIRMLIPMMMEDFVVDLSY
jgi:hypothetical protein